MVGTYAQPEKRSLFYDGRVHFGHSGVDMVICRRPLYYDPTSGRLTTLDPFEGDVQSPQSLHKYLYCYGDPINFVDPSGRFGLAGMTVGLGMMLSLELPTIMQGSLIALTLSTVGSVGGQLRGAGIAMLAAGNIDQGLFVYEAGMRILDLAVYTTETVVTGLQAFMVGTAILGIGRWALGGLAARWGGARVPAFRSDDWIEVLPAEYARPPVGPQTGLNNCGQTAAGAILSESGLSRLGRIFEHEEQTTAAELAQFFSDNGVTGVRHGNASIHTVVGSVRQGKPALALIRNTSGDEHWVIIDEVAESGGPEVLLGIRDPRAGRMGYMAQQDFDVTYYLDTAVWFQ